MKVWNILFDAKPEPTEGKIATAIVLFGAVLVILHGYFMRTVDQFPSWLSGIVISAWVIVEIIVITRWMTDRGLNVGRATWRGWTVLVILMFLILDAITHHSALLKY